MTDDFFAGATGYDPYEYFFASKYRQGGRTVFSMDFSVAELVTFLPKPDPDRPLDTSATQRRIVPAHARQFAEYLLEEPAWVSPALLLRAPDIFRFTPAGGRVESGSTSFGKVGVPKNARSEIEIVDGQHRTLGFHLAWETLDSRIKAARTELARLRQSAPDEVVAEEEIAFLRLSDARDRLSEERVSVQVLVVETPEMARRLFVDINDNAKGITGAVRSRFDDRSALSRALNYVLETNDLLNERVDLEQDRVAVSSRYLLGAKHVNDMMKSLVVGTGNLTKKVEKELDDKELAETFDDFSGALLTAFPDLAAVVAGRLTPAELRSRHLIGSNVMLRAFAVAWWDLRRKGWQPHEIGTAFAAFEDKMAAPVYADPADTWFATGVFPARLHGASSPTSRAQDFRTLANRITAGAHRGNTDNWRRATSSDPELCPQ